VTFDVCDDVMCGDCLPIEFVDGKNGRGCVPIKNIVLVENYSRGPVVMPCEVCEVEEGHFFRSDSNFYLMGRMAVDIADATAGGELPLPAGFVELPAGMP
jgi:hypothetical protein